VKPTKEWNMTKWTYVESVKRDCQAGKWQRLLFQTQLRVATLQKYAEWFSVDDVTVK
jgi:hypothetical protein